MHCINGLLDFCSFVLALLALASVSITELISYQPFDFSVSSERPSEFSIASITLEATKVLANLDNSHLGSDLLQIHFETNLPSPQSGVIEGNVVGQVEGKRECKSQELEEAKENKNDVANESIAVEDILIELNKGADPECPNLDTEIFHCADCGGPDEHGKCKRLIFKNPEFEYEFKGCDCAPDLDFSQQPPPLVRRNFGKGLAKLAKLPDIKYESRAA
ncbi:hypothetical protein BKA64DRAFT_646001 [Cadophora sp. MPI-SDFR-AT-0126]|nr:hypothetical protein BKA64DRAFT_646001 [Leotiomycetes sp. MPI-SDFR-AT-0126]